MRPGPPALDHLSIAVADLDRALAFYRDVLGMTLAWRETTIAVVRAGGTELALNRGSGILEDGAALAGSGLHFGFRVQSVDEVGKWAAYLRDRGVEVRVENGPGVAQAYFQDPDGYTLEIYFPGSQA